MRKSGWRKAESESLTACNAGTPARDSKGQGSRAREQGRASPNRANKLRGRNHLKTNLLSLEKKKGLIPDVAQKIRKKEGELIACNRERGN